MAWRYTGKLSLMERRRAKRPSPSHDAKLGRELPPTYPHHPAQLEAMCGTQAGKKLLLILGGPSGVRWQEERDRLKPDLLMGVNGTIRALNGDLDYWVCMESWDKSTPPVWFQDPCRGLKIVSWKRYKYIEDTTRTLSARRGGPMFTGIEKWNPRVYGGGLYARERFNRPEMFDKTWSTTVLGTVAIQALHLACMVGCSEIYTIGLDLCFSGGEHWYDEVPVSRKNKWWDERMFVQHKGLPTMYWWIDSATFLLQARRVMMRHGCEWWDQSRGLLAAMGMPCR